MATAAQRSRLKSRYEDEIRPALIERFGYSTPMQAPAIRKITLNMGVGDAKQDSKVLDAATEQLATIAGQRPSVRRARKSIAAFKLREGMPVGLAVTLRGERSYEFLDRLVSIAIPRIRDFRGLSPRSFDGRGNYSLGVKEQTIFPEIDYDAVDQVRGLDVTITTSATSDAEAYSLLSALGLPFASDRRPRGFEPLDVNGSSPSSGSPSSDSPSSAEAEPEVEPTDEPHGEVEPEVVAAPETVAEAEPEAAGSDAAVEAERHAPEELALEAAPEEPALEAAEDTDEQGED